MGALGLATALAAGSRVRDRGPRQARATSTAREPRSAHSARPGVWSVRSRSRCPSRSSRWRLCSSRPRPASWALERRWRSSAIFSAAIAVSLARGRTPDCNCFGDLHARPASRRTLVRNGLLAGAGVAALVTSVGGHSPSAVAWTSSLRGAEALVLGLGVVVVALVAVGGWVLITLLRSHGAVLLRLEHLEHALADDAASLDAGRESLPIGARPTLALAGLDGEPVTLADPERETLVLFWSPDCGFCNSMRDELLDWERDRPVTAPRLLVVSSGSEEATRAEGFGSTVVLDPDFAVGTAFGAGGTPMAPLLDREGRVASPLTGGAEGVFALAGGRLESPRLDHTREEVAR